MPVYAELLFTYVLLPTAAMVLLPLGVLSHYSRAADARPVPWRRDSDSDSMSPEWPAAARSQLWRERGASALASAAVVAGVVATTTPTADDLELNDYLAPVLSVVLCTAILLTRPPAMGRRGGQRVSGPIRLGSRWWYVAWAMCLSALVLGVVGAGLISEPDEHGRYMLHTIQTELSSEGTSASGSATIAGWYVGVPIIVAALLLAALVLFALRLQAGSPLATDSGHELWLRSHLTRTVLALSAGAFLVTLSWVLGTIGNAARMTVVVQSPELGLISVSSPLAPLATTVMVITLVLRGAGIALVLLPLFGRLAPSAEAAPVQAPAVDQIEAQTATS